MDARPRQPSSKRFRQLCISRITPSALNPYYSNTMRIEKDENGQGIVVTWALNPRGTELWLRADQAIFFTGQRI